MNKQNDYWCLLTLAGLILSSTSAFAAPPLAVAAVGEEKTAQNTGKKSGTASLIDAQKSDEPTYINSDALQLDSKSRVFEYRGNVTVTQGDLTLTSDQLDGKYTEQNKVEELVARKNVTIVKGPSIRATSNKAVYDAKREMFTLTENPEIHQEGSILTADVVKVYIKEDKSVAEGQVRVKMVKKPEPTKAPATPPLTKK